MYHRLRRVRTLLRGSRARLRAAQPRAVPGEAPRGGRLRAPLGPAAVPRRRRSRRDVDLRRAHRLHVAHLRDPVPPVLHARARRRAADRPGERRLRAPAARAPRRPHHAGAPRRVAARIQVQARPGHRELVVRAGEPGRRDRLPRSRPRDDRAPAARLGTGRNLMAYGASPHDKSLKEAWGAFCDRLRTAGDRVFKDPNPATALQRVDGFRYLTQNLSQAFDLALETKDPKYPALHAFCSPTRKLGSDNADCIYMQAWIDGESVYKISGRKGTARMWNIAVQGPRSAIAYGTAASRPLHEPFGDTPEANLFGHELVTNWDGSFELYVGGERQGQNWLPTTRGSRKIFLRQYFDRWDEEAAEYRIERVGMDAPRPLPTVAQLIEAMQWAGNFVYDVVDYWPDWVWELGDQIDPQAINQFKGSNLANDKPWSAEAEAMDRRRGRMITMMRWALSAGESLILE